MRPAPEVLQLLERCFERGEIETLVKSTPGVLGMTGDHVKVQHVPSGREFLGTSGGTQIRNKIQALLELLSTDFGRGSTEVR
jgi:hypothetical protein